MWLSYLVGLGVSIESTTHTALETAVGVRHVDTGYAALTLRIAVRR